ncbi:MAG: DUF4351 domain-containing protein [Acidobacteriota bacterium]
MARQHDALWKSLLQAFFPDFLGAVAPDVADQLILEERTFLEQEAFVDLPDGHKALLDLLARVPAYRGPERVVLVHVEVEMTFRRAMDRRMWRYFAHLSLKYDEPILPIVLFLRGGDGGATRRHVRRRFGSTQINHFSYWSLGLSRARVDDLLRHGPLGVALASCVRRDLPPDELKLRCLEALLESAANDAESQLLLDAVNTYIKMNKDQEINYVNRVKASPHRKEIRAMELTWAGQLEQKLEKKLEKKYREIGRREGLELGKKQGVELGKKQGVELGKKQGVELARSVFLKILAQRFGELPLSLLDRVDAVPPKRLESLTDAALTAPTLADVEALLGA